MYDHRILLVKVHSTPPVHWLYRHRPLECKHLVCTLDLWVPEPSESNRHHHGCGYMKVEVIEACYFLDGIVFVLQTCTYALLHGPLCCSSEIDYLVFVFLLASYGPLCRSSESYFL